MTVKSNSGFDSLAVRDLISALPRDVNDEEICNNPLADLIANISLQKVPVSSLARMWILGSMQAKIAIGYLAYALKSSFVNDTEKQRLLNDANLNSALKILGTMGYLRGAVMKVGQMLGNLPDVLPREFADILGSLHFEAPPMHYAMIREVFLDELGREPEELFDSFETKAFAAASIGQVHRARLKTGQEVAVKIQYPNIVRTITADMRNLRALVAPMRFKTEWAYIQNHMEDMEEMLKLEADYEREAGFMEQAFEIFKDYPQIVVPGYYKEFSSSRVLTMDYLQGKHLPQYMESNPPLEQRNTFGELISIAIMRLSYHSRSYYADPHPGNFLMMDNGNLGFIDFGCHRELTQEEWQDSNDGEKAIFITHDDELLNKVIAHSCLHESTEDMEPERVELVRKTVQWQGEAAQDEEPFDFSDKDWYQRGMDILLETAKQRQSRYAPVWNWTNRTIWGHRTLMYRLGCKINFRRLYFEHKNTNRSC